MRRAVRRSFIARSTAAAVVTAALAVSATGLSGSSAAEAREAAVDRRLWLTILAAQRLGEIINDLAAAVADPGAADETDVTDKP